MKYAVTQYLLITLLMASLLGCVSNRATDDHNKTDNRAIQQLWPAPPASPRIRFEQAFSTADELGIGRSFWQWLGDVVFGADETHMVRPMDIVTIGPQLIYVADPGVKGVHRFDTAEQNYQLIQAADKQPLPSPVALAADKNGNVYVTDSRLAQLLIIRKGSDHAVPFKLNIELQQPTGLAIADNGDIYLLDTQRHQLLVFNAAGQLQKRIGKRGTGAGEFNFPTHIQLTANSILITDSLNFRIQRFDRQGNYLSHFGKAGQSSGYLSRPKGISTDRLGHIYVVDALLNTLQLFNPQGQLLMTLGEQGQLPGQFWLPTGIYINQQKIYIADSHNRRVQVFRYIGKE